MKVVLARNCGNNRVERLTFSDPYRAHNFYNSFCGRIAAVVECEEVYAIGSGQYRKENCFNCPLCDICVCENRNFTDEHGNHFPVIFTDCTK